MADTIHHLLQNITPIHSTSGTGTEMTGLAVLTNYDTDVKYPVVSYELTPNIVIVDNEICATVPDNITANTGMDALSHCVEAYVSNIDDNYADASCLGGFAFTNAWLGIVHSLSHQIGAWFHIAHGCANAILLPNVIRFNSKAADKYTDLAKMFGVRTAEDLAQLIEKLSQSIGIPSSVKECGVSEEEWQKSIAYILQNAMNDPCIGFNPRKLTIEELSSIYLACYDGVKIDF